MRDPKRIDEMLKELGEIWKMVPDWRFGQLMFNIVSTEIGTTKDTFHIEDDKMLAAIQLFRRRFQ